MTAEREALEALREEVSKSTGVELRWGDDSEIQPELLASGLAPVDAALAGGLAFRRISMIVGEESAGKTLLAMAFMKAAQKRGLPTVFIDVERTWTAEWARHVGLSPADVVVSLPPNGEKAFDVARAVVKSQPAGIIVIDSLAAMPPAAELDEETEKPFLGAQARMIGRGLRDLQADNTGWCIVLINQIREKIGVTYGSPETLPGGKAQRYYSWQIIRMRRGAPIEEGTGKDKRLVGRTLRVKVDKNKQGPEHTTAEIPFYFTGEFDLVSGVIDMALELGVIEGAGGYYTFEGERWHGRRALREAFADEELLARLQAGVDAMPSLEDEADF